MSLHLLVLAASVRTLVLPFENVGDVTTQDWVGSAFEEAVSVHFDAAGYDVVELDVRNRALVDLGFAPGQPISRATAIVLGKALGAERLVVGAFSSDEERLEVEARMLDLERGATVGIVEDYAKRDELPRLSNQVAKNLFRLEAHVAPPGFEERAKRRAKLAKGAIEESARGRVSTDAEQQRRRFEKAVALEPGYLEARLLLGRLLLEAGEPLGTIDVLVGAGEDAARDPKAYFDLGMAYLAVEEWESALQVFGSLTSTAGFEGASNNNYGVALMHLDRFFLAVDAFERAVVEDDTNPTFHFNLGWSLWRSGKGAPALAELETASELLPWDGEVHLLLAAAAASQAHLSEAALARATALTLEPGLAGVDPATVTGWARPAAASSPPRAVDITEGEDVVALVELFDVHAFRKLGRTDAAIQLLQKSLYREPGAIELRRELVELLCEEGELEQAVRELSMMLWTEPSVETHMKLARVYMELRQPVKAFDEVEKALALEPDHAGARRMREELTPPVI